MEPKIESGALVTVAPVTLAECKVGDIVLCTVNGSQYLHLVKAVNDAGHVQIGNNKGGINGWTSSVWGRCTRIEP
jgi:hypothetical protein